MEVPSVPARRVGAKKIDPSLVCARVGKCALSGSYIAVVDAHIWILVFRGSTTGMEVASLACSSLSNSH